MPTLSQILNDQAIQLDKKKKGLYFDNGIGYKTELLNGLLSGKIDGNNLDIDWHNKLNQILLNANKNGNWHIQYQRKF